MGAPDLSREAVILVVDDVARNLQLVGQMLQDEGHDVIPCGRAVQALELAATRQPDLILLDLMMPEMNGFEVCRRLRADPVTAGIPVIFLTAAEEKANLVEAFEAGAVDFVGKPFHAAELLVRVRTHLELKRARDRLRDLNEEKNFFLNVAAHDLNNPLMVIGMNLDLLATPGRLSPKQQIAAVAKGQRMVERLIRLIRRMLDVNRIEAGHRQFEQKRLDLREVAMELVEAYQAPAAKKQIALELKAETAVAEVDRDAVVEILENLVSNALKFSLENTRVTVRVRLRGGRAELAVIDQGPGLTEEDHRRLFTKFAHLSARPTAGEDSSGLGLSIVKRLAEAMHGKVHAEGKPGSGATFVVEFPSVEK